MAIEEYDLLPFRKFTAKSEFDKALHTFEGIIKGITIDGLINSDEIAELENWYHLHQHIIDLHPLAILGLRLKTALADGIVSLEEQEDLLWVCNSYKSGSIYYELITKDIQTLQGILHGILADNKIDALEIQRLEEWLDNNNHLIGVYPYDEICSLVTAVLQDGKLTIDEINMLRVFFSEFIDTRTSYNLNDYELEELRKSINIAGICAVCPPIIIRDKLFSFTGVSSKATRLEIKAIIETAGGKFNNNVLKNTDFLIVGNEGNPCWAFSCYGRKVEKAVKLRKSGKSIIIVHENDFWDEI